MNQSVRILFCNCTYAQVVPRQVRMQVLEKLAASGVEFRVVADLCEMAARKDPAMKEIAGQGEVRIAACFPRSIRWLFHAAGAPLAPDQAAVLNMREQSAKQVVDGLLAGFSGLDADGLVGRVELISEQLGKNLEPGSWMPWFPVIDFDRCNQCKQCLSFCLFGVFGVDSDDQVEVQNPDQCKTNCPACSRVCPTVAIIFPKYEKGPVNGDEVREEHLRGDGVKVDVSALLGGDIHASLRARSRGVRQRFSVSRNQSGGALERMRHLEQMQAELGIPDEVLSSLAAFDPSGRGPAAERGDSPSGRPPREADRVNGVQGETADETVISRETPRSSE